MYGRNRKYIKQNIANYHACDLCRMFNDGKNSTFLSFFFAKHNTSFRKKKEKLGKTDK